MAGYVALAGAAYGIGKDIGTAINKPKKPTIGPPAIERVPASVPGNALQNYLSRVYASNINQQPESFTDWVGSGGKDAYKLKDTNFTPTEAVQLGYTNPQGGPTPFFDPRQQNQLSVPQALFYASQLHSQGRGRDAKSAMKSGEQQILKKGGPELKKLYDTYQQILKMPAGPARDAMMQQYLTAGQGAVGAGSGFDSPYPVQQGYGFPLGG